MSEMLSANLSPLSLSILTLPLTDAVLLFRIPRRLLIFFGTYTGCGSLELKACDFIIFNLAICLKIGQLFCEDIKLKFVEVHECTVAIVVEIVRVSVEG